MFSETINQKINRAYIKGCTKNWSDFFLAGFILFALGTVSAYVYPVLDLWMAFYPLGILCISFFLIFGGEDQR